MADWRPIGTAPTGDEPILIYTEAGEILIVTWNCGKWDDGEGRPWRDPATHWMPLPAPPFSGGGIEDTTE